MNAMISATEKSMSLVDVSWRRLAIDHAADARAPAGRGSRRRSRSTDPSARTCRAPCRGSTACRRTGGRAPRRRCRTCSRDEVERVADGDALRAAADHDRRARPRSRAAAVIVGCTIDAPGRRPRSPTWRTAAVGRDGRTRSPRRAPRSCDRRTRPCPVAEPARARRHRRPARPRHRHTVRRDRYRHRAHVRLRRFRRARHPRCRTG